LMITSPSSSFLAKSSSRRTLIHVLKKLFHIIQQCWLDLPFVAKRSRAVSLKWQSRRETSDLSLSRTLAILDANLLWVFVLLLALNGWSLPKKWRHPLVSSGRCPRSYVFLLDLPMLPSLMSQ
jgi:hypothetical protein